MWLKLEFPLAGVALKQENTGRNNPRCSPFTQVKGFISPAPLEQGSSDLIKPMNLTIGLFRVDTDAQVIPVGADRQRQEIALSSYKVRLQQGCVPGPLTKCVRACKSVHSPQSGGHRHSSDKRLRWRRWEPGSHQSVQAFPPHSTMPTVFSGAPRGPSTVAHDTQGGRLALRVSIKENRLGLCLHIFPIRVERGS